MAPYQEVEEGYDARTRDWYINAINDPNKISITEPYRDVLTKKIVITYSKAIKIQRVK